MAETNPTRGPKAVALNLPDPQVKILRDILTICLEGVRDDLATDRPMPAPGRASREADAYERLLTGLDRGVLVLPDEAARQAVEAMATAADDSNNYAEVVAEHDALFGLLARLGGAQRQGC